MSFYKQYDKYFSDITYRDDPAEGSEEGTQGKPTLLTGLACVLYFRGGHTQPVRQAIANCFEAFEQYYPDKLNWYTQPDFMGGKYVAKKLKNNKVSTLLRESFIPKASSYDEIDTAVSAGDGLREASDCFIRVLTVREWKLENYPDSLDWLTFCLPIDEDRDSLTLFKSLVEYCCMQLNPVYGRAGACSILPDQCTPYQPLEFDLLQRYFGIDSIAKSYLSDKNTKDHILTINWITLLNRNLVDIAQKSPEWQTMTTVKGLIPRVVGKTIWIQAGIEPTLAPVTEGIPTLYKAVSDGLKSIRMEEACLHINGDLQVNMNTRMTTLWIKRFDAEGIWPPYPSHNEYFGVNEDIDDTPTPQPEIEKAFEWPVNFTSDKVYAGDICPKSGNWHAPHWAGETYYAHAGEVMKGSRRNQAGNEVIWYLRKE